MPIADVHSVRGELVDTIAKYDFQSKQVVWRSLSKCHRDRSGTARVADTFSIACWTAGFVPGGTKGSGRSHEEHLEDERSCADGRELARQRLQKQEKEQEQ